MNPFRLLFDWITDQLLFPLWQALFGPPDEDEDTDAPQTPAGPPQG